VIDLDYNTTLAFKMKVIQMIDRLKVNHKVGEIKIKVSGYNRMNREVIMKMVNRYYNVYYILVIDYSGSVDNGIHGCIKRLLR